jgi:hypothetical protein
MELLLVVGLFVLLAAAALCWGCDSRDGFTAADSPRRPGLF